MTFGASPTTEVSLRDGHTVQERRAAIQAAGSRVYGVTSADLAQL